MGIFAKNLMFFNVVYFIITLSLLYNEQWKYSHSLNLNLLGKIPPFGTHNNHYFL